VRGVVLEDDGDSAPEPLLSAAAPAAMAAGRAVEDEATERPASCEKDLASFMLLCTPEAEPLGECADGADRVDCADPLSLEVALSPPLERRRAGKESDKDAQAFGSCGGRWGSL